MPSLWLDRTLPFFPSPAEAIRPEAEFDAVVVGTGLTGLTTALLLARAGTSVPVVEARHPGAGTTGHSTAKVTVLQGTRLSSIRRRHSPAIVRQYVEANLEGQQWLRRYCERHDLPFQIRPAYTYTTTPDGPDAARTELTAAQEAGVAAPWVTETELPYPVRDAVELADQMQSDPPDVRAVTPGEPATVKTDSATLRGGTVVLASVIPILDRGGFWARPQPFRSYAAAFEIPDRFRRESISQPTRPPGRSGPPRGTPANSS